MLAQKDEYIKDASATIYHLSQEEKIRLQCEAREDYYRTQRDRQIIQERLAADLKKKEAELVEKDSAIAEKDSTIAALQAEIECLRSGQSNL